MVEGPFTSPVQYIIINQLATLFVHFNVRRPIHTYITKKSPSPLPYGTIATVVSLP